MLAVSETDAESVRVTVTESKTNSKAVRLPVRGKLLSGVRVRLGLRLSF